VEGNDKATPPVVLTLPLPSVVPSFASAPLSRFHLWVLFFTSIKNLRLKNETSKKKTEKDPLKELNY